MLELDLALQHHQRLEEKGAACNYILPVVYEKPSSEAAVKAHWQEYLDSKAYGDRVACIDPDRWASNVGALSSRFQALRLDPSPLNKNREVELQDAVLQRIIEVLPPAYQPSSMMGYEEEKERLLQLLRSDDRPNGVWLCGLGE
jgi:hypothetical protein